jgi:prophage regulatory protein
MNEFPEYGYVREWHIVAPKGPLPISKSTWWAGVKSGRFPQPVKLGPRITVWRAEDIRELVENGFAGSKSDTRLGERDE